MKRDFLQNVFTHIPSLKTERLILRKIRISDAEDMYAYSSLPSVTRYLLWDSHPSLSYTKQYLEYLQERYAAGDFYDWALILRESGRMIGTCGFTKLDPENDAAEIGYVLHPDYWGNGYATEAANAVIRFGFDRLSLHRITAECMAENTASAAVMERCGMKKEGLLHDAVLRKKEYINVILFAKIRSDS